MKRVVCFFLVALWATVWVLPFPCEGAGSQESGSSSPPRLRNLVAFTPNLEKALIAISEDQCRLTFRAEGDPDQSRLTMIGVDSLLLAPAGRRFPEGLAVRVRSRRREDQKVILETSPVTMAELLGNQEGQEIGLRPEDVEDATLLPSADSPSRASPDQASPPPPRKMSSRAVQQPSPGVRGSPGENKTALCLQNQDRGLVPETRPASGDKGPATHSGYWSRVRDAAVFSTGARLEWDMNGISGNAVLKIENPRLVFKRRQLSFAGKLSLTAGLGFRPAHGLSFKQVLLKVRLKPIMLGMIGPVPLYVRPCLRVLIKGRLTGSIGCSGVFSVAAPFIAGARREAEGWKNISQASLGAEPRNFVLDGNVGELSAKIFVGAAVDFFINDLAGPTLRAGLYVAPGAAATLLRSPAGAGIPARPVLSVFKVKGGAELSIGGALSFFDRARFLVDVVRVELPLYKLQLAGIEVEPRQLSVPGGQGVDISTLRLIPRYRQRLLQQDQGTVALGGIPGDWGVWQPGPERGTMLPGLHGGSARDFQVNLLPFDKAQPLAPGTFRLMSEP